MNPEASEGPGLYVHVPFCARACPYCDFDFEPGRGPQLGARIESWLQGLEREQERRFDSDAARVQFDTLYIGGGTPSLLSPAQLERMFAALASLGEWARAREITVEFNPEHCDDARLDSLAALGVDRVSLGIQSLDAQGLRQLGRTHDAGQALACIEAAHARGLRASADLIVGWPGQSAAGLGEELDRLIATGVEHVSIYALTIEANTPWPKLVRRGLRVLPDDDLQGDLLELCARGLEAGGFEHYEVASYARPGCEAIHNSKYWRWVDVVGIGPSAASVQHRGGRVERRTNPRGLSTWLDPEQAPEIERLEGSRAAAEGLWLGLRRLAGLDLSAFFATFEVGEDWLEPRIARQVELGNLRRSADGRRLAVGPGRWLWHDSIAIDLLSDSPS